MCSTLKGVHTRLNNEPLPLNNQRNCRERKSKIDNGKENQRGTHRREAKQGTMNRAHQLINGIAGNGKARTMNRAHHLINGTAMGGNANQRGTHRYELINGIAGSGKANRKDNEQNM